MPTGATGRAGMPSSARMAARFAPLRQVHAWEALFREPAPGTFSVGIAACAERKGLLVPLRCGRDQGAS